MFYVVVLHSLGKGGVLKSTTPDSIQFEVAWFMEVWAFCAVNIFAMISGYVGFSEKPRKWKLTSLIIMWFQVVLYGVLFTLIFQKIDGDAVSKKDLIDMFFPVTNRLYWYFTAYVGLFFATPILNAAVRALSEKDLKRIFWVIMLFYVVWENLFGSFLLNRGYSFAWLFILYLIGAIIKKCNFGKNMKPIHAWLGIFLLVLVSWSWKNWGFVFKILDYRISTRTLIKYASPTILGVAVLHVIAFSKMYFSTKINRIIGYLAAGAFAAYLINCQRFVWKFFFNKLFVNLGTANPVALVLDIILFSASFVILSIFIDRFRIFLFRALKINILAEKISIGVDKLLSFLGI